MAKEPQENNFSDFQSPHEASVERLVQALDRAYHRPGLLMWNSFLQGLFTAVGAFVGSVIILAASGYLFKSLGGFDKFVRQSLDRIQRTVSPSDSGSKSYQEIPLKSP